MRQRLEERLSKLKSEFESGQKMLSELDAKAGNLRETLLRISGAIQVLEEELKESPGSAGPGIASHVSAGPGSAGVSPAKSNEGNKS